MQSISAKTPITQNDEETITSVLANNGQLASSGLSLNLTITGPASFNEIYDEAALAPGQNETISISLGDVARLAGTYIVKESVSYAANGISETSAAKTTEYIVSAISSISPVTGGGLESLV